MPDLDALKQELMQSHEEYQRLAQEHQTFERRLQQLAQKTMLSQDEEILEKQIKIQKLKLKDRMEEILRAQRESRVSA
jgi:uncharacterized protein YdcH (DUF465 family)